MMELLRINDFINSVVENFEAFKSGKSFTKVTDTAQPASPTKSTTSNDKCPISLIDFDDQVAAPSQANKPFPTKQASLLDDISDLTFTVGVIIAFPFTDFQRAYLYLLATRLSSLALHKSTPSHFIPSPLFLWAQLMRTLLNLPTCRLHSLLWVCNRSVPCSRNHRRSRINPVRWDLSMIYFLLGQLCRQYQYLGLLSCLNWALPQHSPFPLSIKLVDSIFWEAVRCLLLLPGLLLLQLQLMLIYLLLSLLRLPHQKTVHHFHHRELC